jgi:hypothetical protein
MTKMMQNILVNLQTETMLLPTTTGTNVLTDNPSILTTDSSNDNGSTKNVPDLEHQSLDTKENSYKKDRNRKRFTNDYNDTNGPPKSGYQSLIQDFSSQKSYPR